jgi:hypothetical protein
MMTSGHEGLMKLSYQVRIGVTIGAGIRVGRNLHEQANGRPKSVPLDNSSWVAATSGTAADCRKPSNMEDRVAP